MKNISKNSAQSDKDNFELHMRCLNYVGLTMATTNEEYLLQLMEYAEKYAASKINTPNTTDFIEGVKVEMAHHKEKWGDESHKTMIHFTSVLSYLIGKLIKAVWAGDSEKIKHHSITIAAVAGTSMKYFKKTS
jgi:hypothetical protein